MAVTVDPESDDDDDVRRARRGDRQALERLFGRFEDRLRAIAHRRIGPNLKGRVRTSDLLQSTYLAVLRDIGRFEGASDKAFLAWVVRIFENTVRDKARYFEVRRRHGEQPTPERPDVGDDKPGPKTQAEWGDNFELFMRAFAKLSADHQRVLTLKIVDGLSHEQIAEEFGRTVKASTNLLSRARAELAIICAELIEGERDGE